MSIKKINYTHEALANWLLENPHRPLADAALYFDMTRSWISTVIHSDAFQALLAQKQAVVTSIIAEDIPTKMRGLACLALDRLGEELDKTNDPKFLRDTAEMLLTKQGFGNPKVAPAVSPQIGQANFYMVSSDGLQKARELQKSVQAEVQTVEMERPHELSAPHQL